MILRMPVVSGPPILDITQSYPVLHQLREHAKAGEYDAVATQLRAFEEHDQDAFMTGCEVVSSTPETESHLEHIVAERPDDLLARTLLAQRHVVHGWDIRSGYRAQQVSSDQFEQFHAFLRKAEQALIELCAVAPERAHAWHVRLMTARGLELGLSETRRRYDRLAEHHPHHVAGQRQLLQRLLPKWGGTWEDAFSFARARAADAPPQSSSVAMVAQVHYEMWLDLGESKGNRYLAGESAELRDLSARFLDPGYQPVFEGLYVHSLLGTVLALAGQWEQAIPHFRHTGPALDPGVWGYLAGSAASVNRVRAKAGVTK